MRKLFNLTTVASFAAVGPILAGAPAFAAETHRGRARNVSGEADPLGDGQRRALSWPRTKIAGRHLSPYLAEFDRAEAMGQAPRPSGQPVDSTMTCPSSADAQHLNSHAQEHQMTDQKPQGDFAAGERAEPQGRPRDFAEGEERQPPGPPRDFAEGEERQLPGPPRDFAEGERQQPPRPPADRTEGSS